MKRLKIFSVIIMMILLNACSGSISVGSQRLEGDTWELVNLNGNPPLENHQPTLQFEMGQVTGTTGCNHYGGSYQINGEKIHFVDLFSTEMACLDPAGLMEQERIYLELLQVADQLELNGAELTFYSASNPILVFAIKSNESVSTATTNEPENPVSVDIIPSPTSLPVFEPPTGFNPYQDPITGIAVYIPDTWIVTGILEGEYAILQSYPEDKYVGGEMRAPGDTKCDLNIRPLGDLKEDMIQQWHSDGMTTIISENQFMLGSGLWAQRFEIDNMGRAIVFITEINQRVVLLTCFGDFTPVDEIADTLHALE